MISAETAKRGTRIVLLPPDLENLSGLEAALAAGWSPDPRRAGDEAYVHGELQRLRQDRSRFLDDFIPDGKWRAGSGSPPLSTRLFWIWDGELFMRGPHPSDRPDQIKLYFWLRPGVVV
ncbi:MULTISPECIES: hypothetical protein [Rhizobium]|uniref:Uncharacterized protein n=1 Tax=Rhizobium laguerreae TaxID=1076926 RepID=A0A7Y2R4K5_9HYPH|nr:MULTISPECIES: hypothetical protein [Rhizobium]NNH64254.1 hypothetical protein [Rhizobium laguerreae]UWM73607.1 hypothetical protein N1937_12735 [Rhizobium leguminosarum bv. viciae]